MATKVTDPTERFFEALATHGHEPLLRKAAGSTRFDLVDGKRTLRWIVTVEKGDLSVSRGNKRTDCVVRTQKVVFDRIVAGKVNAVAAVLRGDLEIDGDWRLLVWMQRLFPGRHSQRRTGTAGYARRRR